MNPQTNAPPYKADIAVGSALTIVGAVFWWSSGLIEYDPEDWGIGPRLFPQVVSAAMTLLGLALVGVSLRGWLTVRGFSEQDAVDLKRFAFGVLPLVGMAFLYVALVDWVQFLIPTVVVTAGVLYMFGNRGWVTLGLVPVLTGIAYYVLFFGVLRLYEAPGTLVQLDFTWLFEPIRFLLGWR
jgi:putative tricarboxylic transport membrane protein